MKRFPSVNGRFSWWLIAIVVAGTAALRFADSRQQTHQTNFSAGL